MNNQNNQFKKSFNNIPSLLKLSTYKIKKIFWMLGRDAFLFILILILLNVIIVEFLFYRYVLLIRLNQPETTSVTTKFQENTYQAILDKRQERENVFKDFSKESYSNPFE